MQGTSKGQLAAELERCARYCEETAALYVERHGDGVATDVVSGLLLAAAAMDTASKALENESQAGIALMIATTLVDDAIASAERRGLDERLLHCIAELRRVAGLLDA
jgi:hypothetical protein